LFGSTANCKSYMRKEKAKILCTRPACTSRRAHLRPLTSVETNRRIECSMNHKCDRCDKPATVFLTEIINGKKIEKHLCEDCAAAEGITIKSSIPISQLLEDFILQSSDADQSGELKCDVCGMTLSEFRSKGVLGCPNDYEAFRPALEPLLQRAHEGATQHVGKVPHGADDVQKRNTAILRLRAQLKQAIGQEDYEQAARLRDQIKQLEET